ncbi:hypothetical protein [Xenorhabdus sp. KK7.4]|uniref:hypothetical protein n=1 Tax=Xenorhabdus sp. KK7.4 TaxID=1851572 RepID=UPI000C05650A|nr:hypothetical protein [Xenorhabdus sp. KK7.4]PHM52056.1 hypothetical protein Xekk_03281 [Xenorhabdus sp. KK7.4]
MKKQNKKLKISIHHYNELKRIYLKGISEFAKIKNEDIAKCYGRVQIALMTKKDKSVDEVKEHARHFFFSLVINDEPTKYNDFYNPATDIGGFLGTLLTYLTEKQIDQALIRILEEAGIENQSGGIAEASIEAHRQMEFIIQELNAFREEQKDKRKRNFSHKNERMGKTIH